MKKKKILCSLLCGAILLSVAGCGKGDTQSPADMEREQSEAVLKEETQDTNLNAEGLPVLREPETFRIAVMKNVMSKNTFPEKLCVIETEKATNVKIEWIEIPASGWKEKTNIMLASGDLPDAFLGNIDVANNISSLAELDDLITEYAPSIRELMAARPDIADAMVAMDGKIHSLPIGDESYNNKVGQNIWINQKWLDKLGLKLPETTEEFAETLRAFKTQDPNGNGQADEIPFSFNGTTHVGYMFGSFGALDPKDNHTVVVDGKGVFTPAADGYYEALQWMHELSGEGLLDPEAFTQNEEQYMAKYKGKENLGCFISFDPSEVVGAEKMQDYSAVLPLKGPKGDQMWLDTGNVNVEGFVITGACENPGALIRWYDYIRSDLETGLLWNRGEKGVAWDYTEDGKWKILKEQCPADIPYGQWRHTISAGSSAPFLFEMEKIGPDAQEFTTDRDILKVNTVDAYLPYVYKSLPLGIDDPDNAKKRSILLVDIDNYLKRFVSGAVLDGIDDKGWEEHLKTCESLRTAEYEALCQDYADRVTR